MMNRFFKMKNIAALSLLFLQTLLQAKGPPTPTSEEDIVLPIDQYSVLLVIFLIGVAVIYTKKYMTRKKSS